MKQNGARACRRAGVLGGVVLASALAAGPLAAQSQSEVQSEAPTLYEEPAKSGVPFWDEANIGYMFRTASFNRSSNGDPSAGIATFKQAGAGVGGWLYGTTGELANFLSFGATYNFVQPIWSPEQYPFNFILKDTSQSGYGVVGELNARLRYETNTFVIGRQTIRNQWFMDGVYRFFNKLDQSMVGPRDIRGMQWLTYEAATVQGRVLNDSLRYYAGYVTNVKQVNDDKFRNLYQGGWNVFQYPSASREGDSDGMAYVGMNWKPTNDNMISASYHNVQNMLNMVYVDYDHVFRMEEGKYFRIGAQWMYQESNGQSLMRGVNGSTGPSFNTNYGGIYLEARPVKWWIPYAMAGLTSDRNQIYSPFSIGPSYLIQRVGENSRAGERTWILGTTFDFASFGVNGLSFDVTYGQRTNRNVDGNPNLPVADWDEMATDLIYLFPQDGFFKNLRARARYAKVWQKGDNWTGSSIQYADSTTNDVRFDVQLNIPFK